MNLSKENIDKLIFGGIYKIDYDDLKQWCPNQVEQLNDQHYGIWIPVHSINKKGEENYYMIDTYQMSRNFLIISITVIKMKDTKHYWKDWKNVQMENMVIG